MTDLRPADGPGTTASRHHSTLSSVRNAARLLKEFTGTSRELGVSELARRLDLSKSTTHRLLSTLTDERLLEQDADTGAYRLGLAIYELGATVSVHMALHDAADPVIDSLRAATRETVQVAVLDGREVVFVERRVSPQALRLLGPIAHRADAHCTSSGKLLLAYLRAASLDAVLDGWALPHTTPHTIHDAAALRADLATIRHRGWAEDANESALGIASIAAPIRSDIGEVVAAVSVSAPIQRMTQDSLTRFARPAVEAGLAISRRLGYRDTTTGRSGA